MIPSYIDIATDDLFLSLHDFSDVLGLENDINTVSSVINLYEKGKYLKPLDTFDATQYTYSSFAELLGEKDLIKSDVDLKLKYNKFNTQYFSGNLPVKVCVRWSNKMTRGAGVARRVQYKTKGVVTREVHEIALSVPYHQKFPSELDDTLIHEMIHILYPDDSHGAKFKRAMHYFNREHGRNITIFCQERAVINYIYGCANCNNRFERSNRLKSPLSRYHCPRCRGAIILLEDRKNKN